MVVVMKRMMKTKQNMMMIMIMMKMTMKMMITRVLRFAGHQCETFAQIQSSLSALLLGGTVTTVHE